MRRLAIVVLLLLFGAVGSAHAWTWPADGPLLRPFSLGSNPYLGGQHRGIDVSGAAGSEIRAPADGTITFAGTVPGGGKTVAIRTAEGYSVTLVHLGSIAVARGALIGEGSPVGSIGPTGTAAFGEPYVYMGVRIASQPEGYLDPLLFLPSRQPVASAPAPAD